MFQFPAFASTPQGGDTGRSRWVAPFGNPGINGHLPLPRDYRGLSRPSSPPGAKASTVRPRSLPRRHPAPTSSLFPRSLSLVHHANDRPRNSRGNIVSIPNTEGCHTRVTPSRTQKGGVPAAPSGTATLLRLSPSHRSRPRPILAVTDFRRTRLPWLDGRCVQGPGTYSPRHG